MFRINYGLTFKEIMHNLFLIAGSVFIVLGLMILRIRYSPVLHPDAELFIDLISIICSEKGKRIS